MKSVWRTFWKDEQAIGTLELLLIIAVLVILAIAFRKWIFGWVKGLFQDTESNLNNNRVNPNELDPPKP